MKSLKLSMVFFAVLISFQLSEARHTRIIVHFIDQEIDTLQNSGVLISTTGQYYIPGEMDDILPEETKFIIINVDGVPVKGIPGGDVWFFKIHEGNPVSIYSLVPKTYQTNDFFFSEDETNFIPYSRLSAKELLKNDKEASKKLKRHLVKRRLQKQLMYSNVTVLYGMTSLLAPNPVSLALIGYGVLATATSKAMEKSVQRKLFAAVDTYNNNQKLAQANKCRVSGL